MLSGHDLPSWKLSLKEIRNLFNSLSAALDPAFDVFKAVLSPDLANCCFESVKIECSVCKIRLTLCVDERSEVQIGAWLLYIDLVNIEKLVPPGAFMPVSDLRVRDVGLASGKCIHISTIQKNLPVFNEIIF